MIDSSEIILIKTIADCGSLNKAADVLFLSQPTISKRLSRLEDTLKVTLFHRHNGGMTPTQAASYLIQKGKTIESQLNAMTRHIQLLAQLDSGTLNIGVGPIIEQIFIPTLLKHFSEQTGCIRTRLITGSNQKLTELLLKGEIDLAIGPFVEADVPDELICHLVKQDEIIFVARNEHPVFAQATPYSINQLTEYPSIGPDIPSDIIPNLPSQLLERFPTIACDNYATTKSLVLTSDHITGGPRALFTEEIKRQQLREISGLIGPVWKSYCVLRPETQHIPTVRHFLTVVNEHVCHERPLTILTETPGL